MASLIESTVRKVMTRGVFALHTHNRKQQPPQQDHPFLSGIHEPMRDEVTLEQLSVSGNIPEALSGRYLRIGPNPIDRSGAGYHWFLGDGMVHGLRIENGRALWYRNRWIRSTGAARQLGVAAAPGPRHGRFDTVNTNIVRLGGETRAPVEAGSTPVILSETIDSQRYDDFGGTLEGSFSAHPHVDPLTGEAHAITYAGADQNVVHHVVVTADGIVRREEPIPVRHGPSIHDCAITARYVVVLDLPVTFSMSALIGGQGFPYRWNPDHRARVGLLPREGTADDIIWCDIDAAYVFHTANAFDRADGTVAVDVVAYPKMFSEGALGPDEQAAKLERWIVDPIGRRVERHVLDSAPQEFPRPDERRIGQDYRYIYTLALPDESAQFVGSTRLFKQDLTTGTKEVHDFGPSRHPGEFVFVPEHADSNEDEGWLVGLVIDMEHQTTDLVILDARRFEEAPVASVHIPHRIPPGFHGNWIAD